MKKMIKVAIPEKMAAHFAEWNYSKGNVILLSYAKDLMFEGVKVIVYVAVEDGEKVTEFTNEFKNYIQA